MISTIESVFAADKYYFKFRTSLEIEHGWEKEYLKVQAIEKIETQKERIESWKAKMRLYANK